MVIRICLISTMFIFFTAVSNKHEGNFNQKRITVIGKAVVMKHYAAVRTDDSVFYFLEGKDDWDDKHLGKRVKVQAASINTTAGFVLHRNIPKAHMLILFQQI